MNQIKKEITIIISVYNEEKNIGPLIHKIMEYVEELHKFNIKLFFIDDGSVDNTLENIKNYTKLHDNIKYISFTRNFGHEVAMMAGIQTIKDSDAYIFMDGDFQHPPEIIPKMINAWDKGSPLVLTRRIEENIHTTPYKIFSRVFYKVLNSLSDFEIKKDSPDFRLLNKKYASELRKFNEMSPVVRFMLNSFMKETDVTEIPFKLKDRKFGESKYSYWKLFGLAIDSMVSFSVKPLRIALIGSVAIFFLSMLVGVFFFLKWVFMGNPTPGFMTLLLTNISLGAANLFVLSVIGEYIAKIHIEVKKRPMYIISEMNL